jgi:hypothetical protein
MAALGLTVVGAILIIASLGFILGGNRYSKNMPRERGMAWASSPIAFRVVGIAGLIAGVLVLAKAAGWMA